jgi:hypothetical protein
MTMTTRKLLLVLCLAGCGSVDAPAADSPDAQGEPTDPSDPLDEAHSPDIQFLGGAVLDERGDQIDFSSGEPVHTHAGLPVELSGSECTTIYKYGYLLDREPAFGRQTTANPLAMRFQAPDVAPLDPSASAYRVRGTDDEVLQGWTTLTPDDDGAYTVALYRDDIATLDQPGDRHVDVRFRDTTGVEKVASVCWNMHALAAPLEVDAPATAMFQSLFSMSFATGAPIASLVSGSGAPNITALHVVQPTAEPTSIAVDLTPPATTYTTRIVDDFVQVPITASWTCGTTGELCHHSTTPPPDTTSSGALHLTWSLRVLDDVSGEVVCQGGEHLTCSLPGRAADAAPRGFTIYAAATRMTELAPRAGSAERTLLGTSYYGVEGASFDACLAGKTITHTDINGNVFSSWVCMTQARYTEIIALDNATVTFGPATFSISAIAASGADLPARTFTSEPMTWDAGDDDLPGPK